MHFHSKSLLTIALSSVLGMAAMTLQAQENNVEGNKGFDIAARSDRSDRGFGDSDVKLTMVLRNANGDESSRSLRITTLEIPDESEGDKSLVFFDSPKDIQGTALLSL